MNTEPTGPEPAEGQAPERRAHPRSPDPHWRTGITQIERNKILVRGYALDELMGRLSFAEAVYLLLRGELPTPAIGRLFEAVLVSTIDHGATPPSTMAARNVATTGAPVRDCVAAGVLAFGSHHGGDIEPAMRFLESGLVLVRNGASLEEAAEATLRTCTGPPPGFGHRFHSRDPRAARLFQMAHELELDGEYVQMVSAVEMSLEKRSAAGEELPVNVDGAIAAVCGDIGFDQELAIALFVIARVPGLIAHAREERVRQPPMRQIDPKDHVYDGPEERRLPETRK
jgi:citrate synthase